MLFVGFLHEDLISSSFQYLLVFFRERSIASFDQIMVEGGVGVLRWADGHSGEVEVVDGVGGDRGGDGFLLPFSIRLANQVSSSDESKTHNQNPNNLCRFGLKEIYLNE